MDERQENTDELRGYKFCIIPCVAVELLPKIGTTAYAVLGVLAYHANNKSSVCWPSWKRIAEMVGVSRKTVYVALKTLEESGLIQVSRRYRENGQTSNIYTLTIPEIENENDTPSYASVTTQLRYGNPPRYATVTPPVTLATPRTRLIELDSCELDKENYLETPDTANAEDTPALLSTVEQGVNASPPAHTQGGEDTPILPLKKSCRVKSPDGCKIQTRKKEVDGNQPTQLPPAVAVYRSEVHRYPPKSWYGDISQVVGEDNDNLAHWKEVLHYWLGRGWNPTNIAGMLEAYKGDSGGTPPGTQNGVGKEEKAQERKQIQWSSALLE